MITFNPTDQSGKPLTVLCLGAHADGAAGAGCAVRLGLGRNVDHVRLAPVVEVGELAHR